MAGPSPGSLVSSGQNGSLHNVLFYLPQNGNGNQFANEACHNQHGGTLNHLSYMQTSHNRYRPDPGSLNKVHCFPTDNPYSCDRDTNGSYWSYQQHQQQWNQWNQNDYSHSDNLGFKSCWMQQQQQQQQPIQQRQPMQSNNPSCMGFNPQQYNHMQQQQQQLQQQQQQQQQQQIQSQHLQLQQTNYRNNVVATVTVQSTSQSLSRTPSRCDSVRSETCESHCSSSLSGGSGGGIEDMTGQQYGMYQNFASIQQQYPQSHLQQHQEHVLQPQQQQQCFWPSSHYDVQQEQQQQQMDYFRQQQMQQQQQHYYRQHQVIQQQQQQQQQQHQQQTNCYWPRDASPVIQQQQQQQQPRQFAYLNPVADVIPACSSSPIVADTTTISSSTSSPHFPTSDESVECVPVPPVTDDGIESSAEETIPATTTPSVAAVEADAAATTTTATETTTTTTIVSIGVPAGWTRDISGGSVIYISPSGCRISSLDDAANYVQRDGTCKCGLPCPLRLQHVFNFDPSVPCNAATSLDANSPSTCCHKQSLDGTTDKNSSETSTTTTKTAVKRKKVHAANNNNNNNSKNNKTPKILPVVQPQPQIVQQQQQQQPLLFRRSPCPNVDVRQIPPEHNRPPAGSLLPQAKTANGPTFFDDPSAYLAQQTVLLHSSLQNSGNTSVPSPSPVPVPSESVEQEQTQEELLGDLLDCIPDSMEEVLDRQKDVAAAAEAAAQAEKAANLVKQAAAAAAARQQQQATPVVVAQQPQQPTPKPQKSPSVPVSLAPAPVAARSKPPPLAIRPATPASAARSRARAAEASSKSTKSRSPRRTHHQPIQIQSNAKVLQPVQQQLIHQQQQHQFWPAISGPNIGPLRTTSFPFTYHSAVQPATATPIFSTAAIRPGNLPMTFLTSAAHPNSANTANVFNQSLPVLTTRPALAPSGQVVHVLTTPGPMLATAPLAAESSTTVPILTVGPMNAGNHSNGNNNSRGLTRTGKKRKSTPQTVASILQQGAQLAAMTQQQHHQPQQHHQATTLTLSQEPLVYNVQNFQQIQPQQTIQTLALMPDGKTYVVVNSQPAPSHQQTHQQNTGGHWLLSPRPANTHHQAAPTLIAPAGQPVNVFCTTQTPGTTFVLNGASAPTQVLQLQDGTLVQATTEQSNLLANYGGLFIRCPTTPTGTQIFSTSPAVRTLPLPIPIAPGRSPGRSPDSSSIDGVTSSSANTETLVACGEATPPSQILAVRTAHPSPVVQSSQIDSCVQEVETDTDAVKKPAEFNNNVQHWLKTDNNPQVVAG